MQRQLGSWLRILYYVQLSRRCGILLNLAFSLLPHSTLSNAA